MTPSPAAIEQINFAFHAQEDRLLLKLGLQDHTEVSVWLTRRLCKVIWPLLQGLPSATSAPLAQLSQTQPGQSQANQVLPALNKKAALAQFSLEASERQSIDNMNFKADYIEGRQNRTDSPLLATQAHLVTTDAASTHLSLTCKNNQVVKIALNPEIIHAITHMMQLATREAGWDVVFDLAQSNHKLNTTKTVLH